MGSFEKQIWTPALGGIGLPRRDRRGGTYETYVPDRLIGRLFFVGVSSQRPFRRRFRLFWRRARDYIEGLSVTRYNGSPESKEATTGLNVWIGTFAAACARAATDAAAFEQRIAAVQGEWRARLGSIRSDSAVLSLIELLPGTPIITTAQAQAMTGRALSSVLEAMKRLENAGIIAPMIVGRSRKQVYQARDIVDAFTDLERQLASPVGDTQIEAPVRSVPARPVK